MNFSEKDGFDPESISLHDRINAIARSEGCSYSEAHKWLTDRESPQKQTDDGFDEYSTAQAQQIQSYAEKNNLSFSEALGNLIADAQDTAESNACEFTEAFEATLQVFC